MSVIVIQRTSLDNAYDGDTPLTFNAIDCVLEGKATFPFGTTQCGGHISMPFC